ncbi:MAG: universal stress protein [Hyphomicrobiales bacterium]|nr:universal stress protein [Hyphomicrobiales bacterium]
MVTLDTSPESRALLDVAANLAACFEIPLTGLFIEDQDILEFADLPIAREISMTGKGIYDLTRERVQSHFRSQAVAVRRALQSAAARQRIDCAFEIRKGRSDIEITAATRESDLIVVSSRVGALSRPRGYDYFGHFESTEASAVLTYGDEKEGLTSDRIIAVFTGSAAAREGVRLAGQIAVRGRNRLTIILVDGADDLAVEIKRAHPTTGQAATGAEWINLNSGTSIAEHITTVRPRLVVLPSDLSQIDRRVISETGIPVMVVRTRGE